MAAGVSSSSRGRRRSGSRGTEGTEATEAVGRGGRAAAGAAAAGRGGGGRRAAWRSNASAAAAVAEYAAAADYPTLLKACRPLLPRAADVRARFPHTHRAIQLRAVANLVADGRVLEYGRGADMVAEIEADDRRAARGDRAQRQRQQQRIRAAPCLQGLLESAPLVRLVEERDVDLLEQALDERRPLLGGDPDLLQVELERLLPALRVLRRSDTSEGAAPAASEVEAAARELDRVLSVWNGKNLRERARAFFSFDVPLLVAALQEDAADGGGSAVRAPARATQPPQRLSAAPPPAESPRILYAGVAAGGGGGSRAARAHDRGHGNPPVESRRVLHAGGGDDDDAFREPAESSLVLCAGDDDDDDDGDDDDFVDVFPDEATQRTAAQLADAASDLAAQAHDPLERMLGPRLYRITEHAQHPIGPHPLRPRTIRRIAGSRSPPADGPPAAAAAAAAAAVAPASASPPVSPAPASFGGRSPAMPSRAARSPSPSSARAARAARARTPSSTRAARAPPPRLRRHWTLEQETHLLRAVAACGLPNWKRMKEQFDFGDFTPIDLKDKWRNMLKTAHVRREDLHLKVKVLRAEMQESSNESSEALPSEDERLFLEVADARKKAGWKSPRKSPRKSTQEQEKEERGDSGEEEEEAKESEDSESESQEEGGGGRRARARTVRPARSRSPVRIVTRSRGSAPLFSRQHERTRKRPTPKRKRAG